MYENFLTYVIILTVNLKRGVNMPKIDIKVRLKSNENPSTYDLTGTINKEKDVITYF